MDLSIVLCTWNNCRRLGITLEAISRCTVPASLNWELVMVANNCTDATADVARAFSGRLPLRHVIEARQGLSHARNTGLEAARGRLIIFADDDITPSADWIGAYWRAHQERPEGYHFGGPLTCEYETHAPEPELFALAGIPVTGVDWGPAARVLEPYERFMGANWACPAEALRAVGPFDPSLGLDASLGRRRVGEEWDMMQRLRDHGSLPWYVPHAVVTHFVPAHKSRLEYTASNWEAAGVYSASRSVTSSPFLHQRPYLRTYCHNGSGRVGAVPWRTYSGAVRFVLRWLMARMIGQKGYQHYASWRFCRGAIAGFRAAATPPSGRSATERSRRSSEETSRAAPDSDHSM
jgi:glucosyl-dolichyl phosphate glucuronosyltransferase